MRAKKAHPDLGGTEEQMRLVNEAYERLQVLFDSTNANVKRNPLSATRHSEGKQGSDRGAGGHPGGIVGQEQQVAPGPPPQGDTVASDSDAVGPPESDQEGVDDGILHGIGEVIGYGIGIGMIGILSITLSCCAAALGN